MPPCRVCASAGRSCRRWTAIRARTPEKRYGVAFSGGANLADPQNKRETGKVYFFERQDSRCAVYVGDQAKLMGHYVGP